jgi:hypothetical protein
VICAHKATSLGGRVLIGEAAGEAAGAISENKAARLRRVAAARETHEESYRDL